MTTQNIFDLSDLWNDGATTFSAIKMSVTDTASASGSLLMDLQVGGVSQFNVTKAGMASVRAGSYNNPGLRFGTTGSTGLYATLGSSPLILFQTGANVAVAMSTAGGLGATRLSLFSAGSAEDIFIERDAADTLAQRRSTNPQAFRVYNTFTDASNYERGKIAWESNVLRIGTEKAGTGSARALELQTDGVTRLTIAAAGAFSSPAASFVHNESFGYGLITRAPSAGWNELGVWAGGADNVKIQLQSSTASNSGRIGLRTNHSLEFTTNDTPRWSVTTAGNLTAYVDNTYDIGAATASRPRHVHQTGYLQTSEMTAPAAPAANGVRIYAEDDGAGKTRLMALFATGAAQQIAIEP